MAFRADPRDIEAARAAFVEHNSVKEAADALGIARSTMRTRLDIYERTHGKLNRPSDRGKGSSAKRPEPKYEQTVGKDKCTVESVSDRIKTVEDALEYGKVDVAIWEVERFVINSWEVSMKLDHGVDKDGNKKPQTTVTKTLWQIKVWLTRKVGQFISDAADLLTARMQKCSPKFPTIKRTRLPRPHLLEVSLFDAHFGKLAWAAETGESYDLKIAKRVYTEAVTDLLRMSNGFNIDKCLFPVGQDFFHINNANNTTARGTPQSTDGRLAKIFDVGCQAVIEAVNNCLAVAPVEVIWVPGNHDPETSWYLTQFLKAYYRNNKDVIIDNEPKTRKYRAYGVGLIGFAHGDREKHSSLPNIMAAEVPKLWAESKCRHWHLGHYHKRAESIHNAADTYNGVEVRTLPSLSGADAWHYQEGYVKNPRAAEAYLWCQRNGYVAHFNAYVDGSR